MCGTSPSQRCDRGEYEFTRRLALVLCTVVFVVFSILSQYHGMAFLEDSERVVTIREYCERFHTQQEDSNHAIHAWMHIPKTAGTTAYNMYMKALHDNNFTIYPNKGGNDWNTPGCGGKDTHGGTHCARSEIQDCLTHIYPERSYKFHTIIRHPVERVISEYFWWKRGNTGAWTSSMHATKYDLRKWLLDEGNVANNRQAVYFLLDTVFSPDCTAFTGNKTLHWIEKTFGSTDALNSQTITHSVLDKFAFVAIMDDMKNSTAQFKKIFGVDAKNLKSSKDRHSARKQPVNLSIRKLIEDRNRLDMKLYRMAKARLNC